MNTEDKELIKTLTPFSSISESDLNSVLGQSKIVDYTKGKMIFKRAEQDDQVYWLLSGAVDLLDENFEAKSRKAGETVTKSPLDHNSPHRLTAVTTEDTRVLICSGPTIAILMGDGGDASVAEDIDDEEGIDWMSTLLSSPLFEFIPPANIQTLFSKFEEIRYKSGDVVITQGETGDYFYVIQAGRAKVERSAGGKTAVLAELKAGDNFGQDALVSDTPRNATVTMTSSGTLMRLSEPDFQSLLMNPVIETVTLDEVKEMVEQGDPKTYILDVRTPKEVESDKIPGSLNVPLQLLRKNMKKLKEEAVYIVACDGGRRSALGAYQLNEEGFTAYVLDRKSAD